MDFSKLSHVIYELVWPRKWLLLLGLFLIGINRVSGLVLPWATKYLIDDVIGKHNLALLNVICLGVFSAVAVQALTSFSLTQLLSREAQWLITELRIKIQNHIGRLPVSYYDSNKSGSLVSRIMNDAEGVRNLVGTGLVSLLGGFLTAIIAMFFLIRINSTMTFLSMGFVAAFGVISFFAFKKIRPIFRERSKINAEVTGRLSETLGGIRVVKGFHAEDREAASFSAGAQRLFQNVRKTLLANSSLALAATFLMGVVSVSMMFLGGHAIVKGGMTLGDFTSYTLFLGFLVAPVVQMANIGTQLTEAFAGLDRMQEILGLSTEDADPNRNVSLEKFRGHIVFDQVSFSYTADKPVLKGVSLDAKPGSVTALVGSSGAGKSTLISLVAAFVKPTKGKILIDGVDQNTIRLGSYRSHLAVVLQDNFLFDGSVRENIFFGNPRASEKEFQKAVKIAYVDEFVNGFEERYDTIIGERGVKLSGGQRQRVAIARAILADPRILILDEATSNLDSESEFFIQKGLAALMKGRTTFVIAHRLSTIQGADQILVLENGRIVERGKHAELLRKKGRYHHFYHMQMRI
ncbi:MAG: ABC transporter ATP-binding protein [Spirochaetia bacterium]|nr:ABC transporter ATP-binding protein [Spirochaetia bacterium]